MWSISSHSTNSDGIEQNKNTVDTYYVLLSILFCYRLIPTEILTVGAGAIMPIGTGIIGVPEKSKTLILISPVEITDEYKWTDCGHDFQTRQQCWSNKNFRVLITRNSLSIQARPEYTNIPCASWSLLPHYHFNFVHHKQVYFQRTFKPQYCARR